MTTKLPLTGPHFSDRLARGALTEPNMIWGFELGGEESGRASQLQGESKTLMAAHWLFQYVIAAFGFQEPTLNFSLPDLF